MSVTLLVDLRDFLVRCVSEAPGEWLVIEAEALLKRMQQAALKH